MFLLAGAAFLAAWRKQKDADALRIVAEQKTDFAQRKTDELTQKTTEAQQARDEAELQRKLATKEQLRAEAEAGKAHTQSQIAARNEKKAVAALKEARKLAASNEIETALFVSDPLHSERIKRMALDLGFQKAYTSPANYTQLERSRQTKLR